MKGMLYFTVSLLSFDILSDFIIDSYMLVTCIADTVNCISTVGCLSINLNIK